MGYARRHGELCAEGVPLQRIATAVGTPVYVYSWRSVHEQYRRIEHALAGVDHRICYAVKANSNLAILARLAELGAGFDIVSGGELERVLRAGGDPKRVVFSGVGKSTADIDFGIKCGIDAFNVESASELARLEARAGLLGCNARVSVRVNPDVDANTHPYIATGLKESKFGVPPEQALELYCRASASPDLTVAGIDCHIGSQIVDVEPFEAALTALLQLVDALDGEDIALDHVDIGGGFGVTYGNEPALDLDGLGEVIRRTLADRTLQLRVEPGRSLVADAGILLTRVEYLKPAPAPGYRNIAVVDAAMNDLIRPALYQAWHAVEPVVEDGGVPKPWDIVGPICETGDFLALDRELALNEGDLLAIRGAGAYGFAQSSNYNTRPRAAEVLVTDEAFAVVRRRETISDLLGLEMFD
ncbi:MAG: diaminopimelate decarboxylase [Gammaproteobacteria bacterium]|nr:diaminopimelate decarboxylase [Gammaproteobacteria bacterium]MXY57275.1 diaminopimelate decarboxylase [Gammaproteobacteria bacterium]MYF30535.1 diaminopimelate decarboxylase [Gammaproteobacteria bacterium]MYK47264.1 diaminopimelate decarboxylase [Gammaproteobacteria bacterium]